MHAIEPLAAGRTLFLKASPCNLVRGRVQALPAESTVIEIPSSAAESDEVFEAAQDLRGLGFQLALDEVSCESVASPLARIVDLVKVDISASQPQVWRTLATEFTALGVKLIANHVDTRESVDLLTELGFEYFQGFFFARPTIDQSGEMPTSIASRLLLLREINRRELDLEGLARAISSDLGLTHKLLTLLNSAALGLRQHVTSIQHAVRMLGENGLRKWAAAILLRELAEPKPPELAIHSLTRAGFCEIFAERGPLYERSAELYLMGLFSHLDAILDRPMDTILDELPLAPDIKQALLGEPNQVSQVLEMARAYEKANWSRVEQIAVDFAQQEERVASAYCRAVAMADIVLN